MNLMNLLEKEGGSASVAKLAQQLGVDPAQASKIIEAVSPELVGGMQRQAKSADGRAGLASAIESDKHQRYLDEPERVGSDEMREDGNNILGHLLGGKDGSRNVADHAAQETGIDSSLIEKALPIVAGLAMGAMGHRARTDADGQGALGALSGLLGDDGNFDLGDVKNAAGRFL